MMLIRLLSHLQANTQRNSEFASPVCQQDPTYLYISDKLMYSSSASGTMKVLTTIVGADLERFRQVSDEAPFSQLKYLPQSCIAATVHKSSRNNNNTVP